MVVFSVRQRGVTVTGMRGWLARSCLLKYGGTVYQQSCMSVRFDRLGSRLLALRRRLPPALYKVDSTHPIYQFDNPGYYNSCTMKSCCFAGDRDQVTDTPIAASPHVHLSPRPPCARHVADSRLPGGSLAHLLRFVEQGRATVNRCTERSRCSVLARGRPLRTNSSSI